MTGVCNVMAIIYIKPRAGVPKLGYMCPYGYICLSEGAHLRLAIEGKKYVHTLFISNYL